MTLSCIKEEDGTSQVKYLNRGLDYFYTCRADFSGTYPQGAELLEQMLRHFISPTEEIKCSVLEDPIHERQA